MFWVMFLAMLGACGSERNPSPPPQTVTAVAMPVATPVGAPLPSPVISTPEEVQAAYALCHDRVEGKSTPGECKTDTDCATAGCSNEMCVTAVAAKDIITTCEMQACFAVLSQCGCVEGLCQWSIAPNARSMLRPNPIGLPQPQ